MADIGWGNLIDSESYGRLGDKAADYAVVTFEDTKHDDRNFQHASHAMLFCRNNRILWDLYPTKASLLMHMRFDGLLGFPGGLVDLGEDPVTGLNRELKEEVALHLTNQKITACDHVASYAHEEKKLFLHFYGKEVSEDEFKEIEINHLQAEDHGSEVLGPIRPPLFTMGDGVRGFPAFLRNQFAGNARDELLRGLLHFHIMTEHEIQTALKASAGISSSEPAESTLLQAPAKREMEES